MPNWKKVITSGSDAILNQITASGGIDTPDITIDDWGSVSASLASIEAGATSTTLQEVTNNGSTTTNNITITGSLKGAATGVETQFAHLQGNSLDLGKAGSTDTYLKLNGQNGFLKIGPQGSTIDIYTDENFINVFTSGSNTSFINNYNLNGPAGQVGAYIGQSLQLINSYGGSGTSATFNLNHRAVGRIGPAGGSSVQYEYLTVQGANYNQNDDVEVNLYGDIIRISTTTGSFGQYPRIQLRQFGTEVYGNLSVDGSGITGMDGSINASGAITGSDVKINGFASVSASLADLAGTVGSGTISGRPLGSNLENLGVDDVTLQLSSGTTYNGSTALTISAKTGSVSNGSTNLTTGDAVYDYVNPISASIASDIASIQGSGYVDVSSGGASNRIAIFSDADSLKGDSDVTYYTSYNPQAQVYGVWDDVNSEGIKSKTLTTQAIYVGQVGTNFTASIALESNVGPVSWYTETKAVGFNVPTSGTHAIHVDTGYAFFINYHLGDSTNFRAGTITINTNIGSSVVFSETSTADLGDTSAHTFSVGYSSGIMTLSMTTTGGCEGTMEVRRMVSI